MGVCFAASRVLSVGFAPLVKAVLCGHCHEAWEKPLSATDTQYVAAATYKGEVTYLEIS